MNTTFAAVVMMIFPPCFLDFLVPAFNGEARAQAGVLRPIAFFGSGPAAATTDAGYNRVATSCKVHLVRPTCFMYVAKSQ
jgi:uncharacterized ion transporter superfamily protein YfcC